MLVTKSTSSYNDRRYGKPWIAKLIYDPSQSGNLRFNWGKWIGDNGSEGQLEIEVNIGDYIALGQKDFRKPRNSAPEFYLVLVDGTLQSTTRIDAYNALRQRATKPEESKQ
jgi:hypothetical protein